MTRLFDLENLCLSEIIGYYQKSKQFKWIAFTCVFSVHFEHKIAEIGDRYINKESGNNNIQWAFEFDKKRKACIKIVFKKLISNN